MDFVEKNIDRNVHMMHFFLLQKRRQENEAERAQNKSDNVLHIKLLESETQHFTPENSNMKPTSDSEVTVVLKFELICFYCNYKNTAHSVMLNLSVGKSRVSS